MGEKEILMHFIVWRDDKRSAFACKESERRSDAKTQQGTVRTRKFLIRADGSRGCYDIHAVTCELCKLTSKFEAEVALQTARKKSVPPPPKTN